MGQHRSLWAGALALTAGLAWAGADARAASCEREIHADVVALDQPIVYNRLGAMNPAGMMFALRHDVVPMPGEAGLAPGKVMLRLDKRPRPLVLRMNVGDCLTVAFENLLAPQRAHQDQPVTRLASVHVAGLSPVTSIADDGSFVGRNPSSLVAPGDKRTYKLHATKEGSFLLTSGGAMAGAEGDGGTIAMGLFGAVNVEPRGSEWYRSQLTAQELAWASGGQTVCPTPDTTRCHPRIDYDAVYPAADPRFGRPIVAMTRPRGNGLEIVHSDLTAIVTGPNRGVLPVAYPPNPAMTAPNRSRSEPFREFTIIFHDEIKAVQAFDDFFSDPVLMHTLHGVRDGFAINYGTGGIGAMILANRLGVGPMAKCVGCKAEEFFLSSWAAGDPAQIVDLPATAARATGGKATKALYPDDPSNVYHSYLGDHVRIHNLHAGPAEHHIFHLHAHQWLQAPDSDSSLYLDSQAIGPGSAYSYDIAHDGAGNRNKTAGDSIFHCHFYPHFAQGMWALWRVHDVFEAGTQVEADGKVAEGARALPDGEIMAGTPIPAVVPLPHLPMAPMPGKVEIVDGQVQLDPALARAPIVDPTDPDQLAQLDARQSPGYPFFVPGLAGQRPPQPPLDMVWDGGLPRHILAHDEGTVVSQALTRDDFDKVLVSGVQAFEVPQAGTAAEQVAMAFHNRTHTTVTPSGQLATFETNGRAPKPGAPYADPCVNAAERRYRAANLQLDMKVNKLGWHMPQARILALWEDVPALRAGTKAPEPFFFRANSGDCVVFEHANLLPGRYEKDDFQVRTPTDMVGQHIHLVKFDVTSSDGSGNGWNYEDGTFSPDEVAERILAINTGGAMWNAAGTAKLTLAPKTHPLGQGVQVTLQRWFADDVTNNLGEDRTLRTVFTHDHFGPSTHQQVGVYAALVIEPAGSKWRDSETGVALGTRPDGGPTSWRADIIPPSSGQAYREFLMQVQDFALAYTADGKPVSPPALKEVPPPRLIEVAPNCPGGVPRPCPEAISAEDPGTWLVNYRNEPIALRVLDPNNGTPRQAAGDAGDLALAYSSTVKRAIPALNQQPGFYPPLTGDIAPGDPYTPILRAYHGDRMQLRLLTGAHEEGHIFGVHGLKWLKEVGNQSSGWRAAQMLGISEHFEFDAPMLPGTGTFGTVNDYLYKASTSSDGQWNGAWGLIRTYKFERKDLKPLPNNAPRGKAVANSAEFVGVCPRAAPKRLFEVTAVRAADILPGGMLVYNSRTSSAGAYQGPLSDPSALMYVRTSDLVTTQAGCSDVRKTSCPVRLKPGVPVEPLVLRANAGDCIDVEVINRLPAELPDHDGYNRLPMQVENFNANDIRPSSKVGLHAQLVTQDVSRASGQWVGLNAPGQLAEPGGTARAQWYAGHFAYNYATDRITPTPVEFGAINLLPADPIEQGARGLVGALVIEPQKAKWAEDTASRAQATVTKADGTKFREFVAVLQGDVNLVDASRKPIPDVATAEDAEDAGHVAVNYRVEPLWFRLGYDPETPPELTRDIEFGQALANVQVGGDPETPVFKAPKGMEVRIRLLQGAGSARNGVIALHGHAWPSWPYVKGTVPAQTIGDNGISPVRGAQEGMGVGNHFDIVLPSAGGPFQVEGDYLLRDHAAIAFSGGRWAILRVEDDE